MSSIDRAMLRLHVEAVWGVRLPPIEQQNVMLVSESRLPDWRLYSADLAEGRMHVWRPDVTIVERETLLERLGAVSTLPPAVALPPGISREVAFRLDGTPKTGAVATQYIVKSLTLADYALVEAFQADFVSDLLQPACYPFIGVIVEGRLLSLAHSSRRTTEACELGIDTLPEARRKGYALAATKAWSSAIIQEGLVPIYSALAENTASLSLAVAAGYREFARATTLV